jgi:hypothetical protein
MLEREKEATQEELWGLATTQAGCKEVALGLKEIEMVLVLKTAATLSFAWPPLGCLRSTGASIDLLPAERQCARALHSS